MANRVDLAKYVESRDAGGCGVATCIIELAAGRVTWLLGGPALGRREPGMKLCQNRQDVLLPMPPAGTQPATNRLVVVSIQDDFSCLCGSWNAYGNVGAEPQANNSGSRRTKTIAVSGRLSQLECSESISCAPASNMAADRRLWCRR